MSRKTKSAYLKAARLNHGGLSQAKSTFQAKIHCSMAVANCKASALFKNNDVVLAEMERLNQIDFDAAVLSKKEKLETSASISRALTDRITDQLEGEDEEIDHKALDSWVKVNKRDDSLQGHAIQAEVNPQDKGTQIICGWVAELIEANDKKNRIKEADVVDI